MPRNTVPNGVPLTRTRTICAFDALIRESCAATLRSETLNRSFATTVMSGLLYAATAASVLAKKIWPLESVVEMMASRR